MGKHPVPTPLSSADAIRPDPPEGPQERLGAECCVCGKDLDPKRDGEATYCLTCGLSGRVMKGGK